MTILKIEDFLRKEIDDLRVENNGLRYRISRLEELYKSACEVSERKQDEYRVMMTRFEKALFAIENEEENIYEQNYKKKS